MFRTESPREGLKDGEDVDVSTGVSQLANFGSILSSTLGAFNKNIHRLEEFQNKSGASLSDIGHKFESQRKIINDLGVEVEDIKLNVDEILRKIQLLEREIASRIDDSNAHMQKEIMVQRTTAKIELNNMKQSIHNSMNETLELFARLQGDLNKNPITAMTGLSDNEMVAKIAERLGKIESALSVQSRFNEQMSRAVENDGLMQLHSFEAVHQQISALETSLKQTKTENYNLKVALEDVKTQLSKALKGQSRGSRPDSAVAVLHPGQESVLGKLEEVGQALADGLAARIPVNGVVIGDDTVAITPVEMGHMSPPESKVELVQEVVHVADEGLLRRIDDIESMLNTIQEELRTQRHGFGSRFEKMECSLDLFSDTNNAGIREVAERLTEIQDIVQTFSGSSVAIKRLQMAMNDVIADVDELKFQQNNREPEDINDVLQRVGTNGSSDGSSGSGFNLSQQLATVKQKWREFREDLDNGLDYFADVHASDPEGSEALESVFIHRLAAFADRLDSVLFAFDQPSGKSSDSVLDTLFQPLDALTVEVDTLMELDRVGRTSMGITFDDVTNNKSGGKNIRDELRKVYEASLPLLDQRVDKITMRRRIQRLENLVVQKSDKTQMAATEQELRRLLAAKADQQDFLKVASKKVSLGEMAQFKDQVMKQIIALRGYEYERVPFSPDASTTSTGEGMMAHAEHKIEGEVKTPRRPGSSGGEMATHVSHLSERFDILHKRHQELTTQCTTYVPREEVEQALQAILAEMRQMKNNSISPDVLKESLQTKANAAEVQR
jgi:predicted metal-dependent enzyme (double-stranded beta helix superfamily)